MNSTTLLLNSNRFKGICSGRDCKRKPTTRLRIKYLKRVGEFCELCANDLMEAGLVEESVTT